MNGLITSIKFGYGFIPSWQSEPEIPPGEQIKLSIDWQATEDAWNWTTAVVAYVPGTWEILDVDTEIHYSPNQQGNVVLNLKNMTNSPVTIAVVLWGHPDFLLGQEFPAGDGAWQQLDYKEVTINPVEEPPEEIYFSGIIEGITPVRFEVGDLIKITVSYKAYAHNWVDWINWSTRVTVTLDGMREEEVNSHIGEEAFRDQVFRMGTMTAKNLSGTVKLEATGEWLPGGWELLATKAFNITFSGAPPNGGCTPGDMKCENGNLLRCNALGAWTLVEENSPECVLPEGKEFPWIPAVLIGGGAAIAIAAVTKKTKNK